MELQKEQLKILKKVILPKLLEEVKRREDPKDGVLRENISEAVAG
jgi:hypothetical protein